jgi:ketosteroid isomerase-like protein
MREPEPLWYRHLRRDPFLGRRFTEEHMERIERLAADPHGSAWFVFRGRRSKAGWTAAICAVLLLGIGFGVYFSGGKDEAVTIGRDPNLVFPPATMYSMDEPVDGTLYRLKMEVDALPEPIAYGSMPAEFTAKPDDYYRVEEEKAPFVKITPVLSSAIRSGWVPQWYLSAEPSAGAEKVSPPETMIVSAAVTFRLFPEEPEPSGYELEPGKVVQVTGRSGDWRRVNIISYDSPNTGEKWVPASALTEWDPAKAKEGLLKPGAVIYNEQGEVSADVRDLMDPIRIVSENEARYQISSAGGFSGYIDKQDFEPGPFLRVVEQKAGPTMDPDWLVSPEEFARYGEFVKAKSDEHLKGLEPIEVFRYYVTSVRRGDYETAYALFYQGGDTIVPSLEAFLSDIGKDPAMADRERTTWEDHMRRYQLDQQIHGDTAQIMMSEVASTDANMQNRLTFQMKQNADGVWKVNWMPLQ